MKVLLVTHHWPPYTHHSIYSGYERIAYYLNELCDVTVLTWKCGKLDYTDTLDVKRVNTSRTDFFLERRLLLSAAALHYCKHYDIVHALYPEPGLFPSFKHNTVASVHLISDIKKKDIWWKYDTLIQRQVYKRAKSSITVSSNLKDILENKYHIKNAVYIPHGVDTKHFSPEPLVTREKERLLDGKFDFLCLTSGLMGTRSENIFEIAKQLPEVLFIGIGFGKSHTALPLNVKLLSHISEDELKGLYNCADLFIKPVQFATANNSILEAMSMGKAIVTNAIPGVLDYLDDDCAYLVQQGHGFLEVIDHALKNEEDRKLKGLRAREKAEKEFDWPVVADKVFEVYKSVLS
jgi:glycosyltransferase involved in cell wall biosynthesis